MSSKTFLLSILLMVLTLSAFISKVHAQSDVLREIKNDFIERKGDWKSGNKYNFFKDQKLIKISLGKENLKLKNSSASMSGIEIATEGSKRFWSDYKDFKISVSVLAENGKFAGLSIQRYRHTDATNKKHLDQQGRTFTYVINDQGSITISTSGSNGVKVLHSAVAAPASFKAGSPSRLSISRIGMDWKFYLNDAVVNTYYDNSNNSIESINFITDANSSAEFTEPSYVFYQISNNEPTFRSTINGKFTYTDNVAGFMVNEDELKACPTTGGEDIKYQTKPCPEMEYTTPSDYGEMLIGFANSQYGKDDEKLLLDIIKEVQLKSSKTYSATSPDTYRFTGDKDVVPVRYVDETYEIRGKPVNSRYYYYYTRKGMLYIRITALANQPITNNKFYKACMRSIIIKTP